MQQAAALGAELVVLPEYFCAMGARDTDKLAYREVFGQGPIQDFMAGAARQLQLWVVAGTLPLQAADDSHVLNTRLGYSPDGECVARRGEPRRMGRSGAKLADESVHRTHHG